MFLCHHVSTNFRSYFLVALQNHDQDNVPFVIGVLVVSFVVITSILGILFYQRRKKKALSLDKESYNISSPKTDVTSPMSSPTSQDKQQHQDVVLTLPTKSVKSSEMSESSIGPVSNDNSNSSTSSTISNLMKSTERGNLFAQSDSYDGDFFSSSDDENPFHHNHSTPSIIIETQSSHSESSSSTVTPQSIRRPPAKKKIWYPFKRKTSGTSQNDSRNFAIQHELALQEDSSVSSWSNGSSTNATFLHENDLQSSPTKSNQSDDESESLSNHTLPNSHEDLHDNSTQETSSNGSTKTFMDELDRAIESGDWNVVQTHAALMLDDVGDSSENISHDGQSIQTSLHSHSISSATKRSSLSKMDIENIVDAGNWKGSITPLKDSESAPSSSGSVMTDDFHSCDGDE